MAVLKTGNAQANEIIKSTDIQFAFEQIVENTSLITQMLLEAKKDFVIGGKVSPYGSSFNISVAPIYGVCADSGLMFGDTETKTAIAVSVPDSKTRIDIVQVKGEWQEYDEQQRAFNNFDTDTQTYQNVYTKKKFVTVIEVKSGTPGSLVAPDTDEGYVKIAEIVVNANATKLYDDDIYNITSDVADLENENWTNEKDKTYNVGFISDVNERFRTQHNEDGTHKENIITTKELDIGISNTQINGNTLPTGGEVTIGLEEKEADASLYNVISSISQRITSLFNDYQKYGTHAIKGEINISELINENSTLSKAFSIGTSDLEENRYFYIKFNGNEIFKLYENGIVRVLNSNVLTSNDLVSKSITDAIYIELDTLDKKIDSVVKESDTAVYSNRVFERYDVEPISLEVATTTTIELTGLQDIDGVSVVAGDLVLVKNQDNSKQNGIYEVSATARWSRCSLYPTTTSLKAKLFVMKNGTSQKGKIFYAPKETYSKTEYGTDEIAFSEYFASVNPIKNKIALRDSSGHLKATSATSSNDCVIKSDLLNLIYPVGSLYWSSKSTNPSELFGGTWTQIKDKFILAAGDTYTAEATGGNATITLTESQLPSHKHTVGAHAHGLNSHTHSFSHTHNYTPSGTVNSSTSASDNKTSGMSGNDYGETVVPGAVNEAYTAGFVGTIDSRTVKIAGAYASSIKDYGQKISMNISHTHNVYFKGTAGTTTSQSTSTSGTPSTTNTANSTAFDSGSVGSGSSINILPPYVVKYCWERTA